MGGLNPDRWSAETWRAGAETVGQMKAAGWDVISNCPACGLTMRVDLNLIVRVKGPRVSLWNRRAPCRRLGCLGKVRFQGRPPLLSHHIPLEAEWPERGPPRPR